LHARVEIALDACAGPYRYVLDLEPPLRCAVTADVAGPCGAGASGGPLWWRASAPSASTLLYALDAPLAALARACTARVVARLSDTSVIGGAPLLTRTENSTHALYAGVLCVSRTQPHGRDTQRLRHSEKRVRAFLASRASSRQLDAVPRARTHAVACDTACTPFVAAHAHTTYAARCTISAASSISFMHAHARCADADAGDSLELAFATRAAERRLDGATSHTLSISESAPPCDAPGATCAQTWHASAAGPDAATAAHGVTYADGTAAHVAPIFSVGASVGEAETWSDAEPALFRDAQFTQLAADDIVEEGTRLFLRLTGGARRNGACVVEHAVLSSGSAHAMLLRDDANAAFSVVVDDDALSFLAQPLDAEPGVYAVTLALRCASPLLETRATAYVYAGCAADAAYDAHAHACVLVEDTRQERVEAREQSRFSIIIATGAALAAACIAVCLWRVLIGAPKHGRPAAAERHFSFAAT
jgi:hypothetical protein